MRVAIEGILWAEKEARPGGDNRTTELDLQQAFPIWTPAWPTWREITSRILVKKKRKNLERGSEEGSGLLGEVAHRKFKDVDKREDDGHEETIPPFGFYA